MPRMCSKEHNYFSYQGAMYSCPKTATERDCVLLKRVGCEEMLADITQDVGAEDIADVSTTTGAMLNRFHFNSYLNLQKHVKKGFNFNSPL